MLNKIKSLFNRATDAVMARMEILNIVGMDEEQTLSWLLEETGRKGLQSFSVESLCILPALVTRGILARAETLGAAIKDGKGTVIALKPEPLARELDLLEALGHALDFSPALHAWVDDRLTAVAHRLAREHTYDSLAATWRHMDENGRLAFLKAFGLMQTQVFSDDHLRIKPARLDLSSGASKNLGSFCFENGNLLDDADPLISLNPHLLAASSLDQALFTMVHEQLHSTLRQMAVQRHRETLPAGYPLAGDAALMLTRMKYNSYVWDIFKKGYLADVEERLCHKAHNSFVGLYKAQTFRRHALTDRIARRPD